MNETAVSTADYGVVRRLSENQLTDFGLSTIFKNYSSDFDFTVVESG